jgi:hypothetical protein
VRSTQGPSGRLDRLRRVRVAFVHAFNPQPTSQTGDLRTEGRSALHMGQRSGEPTCDRLPTPNQLRASTSDSQAIVLYPGSLRCNQLSRSTLQVTRGRCFQKSTGCRPQTGHHDSPPPICCPARNGYGFALCRCSLDSAPSAEPWRNGVEGVVLPKHSPHFDRDGRRDEEGRA